MKYSDLKTTIDELPLFDTHEHFVPEEFRNQQALDFTYFLPHYFDSDLVSSGMGRDSVDSIRRPGRIFEDWLKNSLSTGDKVNSFKDRISGDEPSDLEKWEMIKGYWINCQNTGYAKCIQIALRDIFEIDELNKDTIPLLTKKLNATRKKGWFDQVLKNRAYIDECIVDNGKTNFKHTYFHPSIRFDDFISLKDSATLERIVYENEMTINSLNDLRLCLEKCMERRKAEGVVAVKTGLAYDRPLLYENVSRHQAEVVFDQLFTNPNATFSWKEAKPLQDYMMHRMIRNAIDLGIPIQIHTGLQNGDGNIIANSDPVLLTNIFQKYPNARFDIFHAGYPFHSKLSVLAKNFQNVYADLCWMPIISPWKTEQILQEWLETIPINKIFAFGGDFTIVEGAYGNAVMTREVLVNVLFEKFERGYFSEDQVQHYARMLMYENACNFFAIKE